MSSIRQPVAVWLLAAVAAQVSGQRPAAAHWAFTAPARPVVPAVEDAWCRDDLDRLVLAGLTGHGLRPQPEADRPTWLRRVHLALTGLPPTPAAVTAFVADSRPDAFERRVDELLASPAGAERLTGDWLDLARYADTFGYQADFEMRVWPWRDWVLQAFLRDLPYDRFVTEQLAGDLLPDADDDSRLATAFLRLHRQTNEGGSIPAEFRQENISDRVHTVGTALLGLTTECARCHDHKYDPLTQRDYYALAALFSAIDETGVAPYTTGACPPPAMGLPDQKQRGELRQRQATLTAAVAAWRRARIAAAADPMLAPWQPPPPPVPIAAWRFDAATPTPVPNTIASAPAARLGPGLRIEPLAGRQALCCNGDDAAVVDGLPAFTRDDAFSLAFALHLGEYGERQVVLHTSAYTIEADAQGYQVLLRNGQLCWEIVHCWPGSAIGIRTAAPLAQQRWHDVVLTYDGSSTAAGLGIWIDGAAVPCEVVADHLDGVATARALHLGARDRDRGLRHGALADVRLFDRCLLADEIPGAPPPDLPTREELRLRRQPAVQAAAAAVSHARRELHVLADALPRVMVMRDRGPVAPGQVLRRGAYDQPDPAQTVAPGPPGWLHPVDATLRRDRLGLAQWLFSPRHPLTARVAVDRLWRLCFGRGLVHSPEDFGTRSELPTHRDVLDLLACEFADSGWRIRPLLRRIVLSATFRQDSAATPAAWQKDPDNELLARGPSFRLSAEMLRDQALAASGLLAPRLFGPSVRPWQPPGLWRDAGIGWGGGDYHPDTGDDAHRRSLYTWRKRTAPPPNMTLFDAPSREVCVAARAATITPLQPLVLWNDLGFVECAQALAARHVVTGATPAATVMAMFAELCGRQPEPAELQVLLGLHAAMVQRYAADPNAAAQVVGAGRAAELAPFVLLASTLFGSDAAMVCR
ncbi:MAG: DUF1553 domain-containing protein [Planctomycetes bacterium]|nr:DUF1553 domain-containing protein [Planctomycetota bacterium]